MGVSPPGTTALIISKIVPKKDEEFHRPRCKNPDTMYPNNFCAKVVARVTKEQLALLQAKDPEMREKLARKIEASSGAGQYLVQISNGMGRCKFKRVRGVTKGFVTIDRITIGGEKRS